MTFRVKDERTLISAKNCVDLSSIAEVRSYITEWPRFFGPPCIIILVSRDQFGTYAFSSSSFRLNGSSNSNKVNCIFTWDRDMGLHISLDSLGVSVTCRITCF